MLKADLHVHTEYSMDCQMPLKRIIECCQKRGINCLNIADHGTVEGALKMREIAPFPVIISEEVLTPHGEIMGMFLKETVPSGQSVEKVLEQIKEQGGLVCIPHPFDRIRKSALDNKVLEQIAGEIDVIEVWNSRITVKSDIIKARKFAERHGIAMGAGSDAHTFPEIGNSYVEIREFENKEEFLTNLAEGNIVGHRTNPLTHISSSVARLKTNFKKMKMIS